MSRGSIMLVALSALLACAVPRPTGARADVKERLIVGLALYRQGDADGALKTINEVLAESPNDARAWNYHGLASRLKGDNTPLKLMYINLHPAYQQAVKDFDKAIALDPKYAEAYYNRGMMEVLFETDKQGALEFLSKAVALDEKNTDAYYQLGRLMHELIKSGERQYYGDALNHFSKALALRPQWPEVYYERALTHYSARKNDAALADFDAAIAQRPTYQAAWRERGMLKYNLGRYREGAADFTKLIELQGDVRPAKVDEDGYYWRIIALTHAGEVRAVLADCDKIIALRPQDAFLFYDDAGDMALQLRELQRAVDYYTLAIAKNPRPEKGYAGRGKAYFNMKEYDKALADFSKVLEKDPRNTEALLVRGAIYGETGKLDLALADMTALIALKPSMAAAYYVRGTIYVRQKKNAAALAEMNKTLALWADYTPALLQRAMLHADAAHGRDAAGTLDKALADLTLAIKLEPNNAEAYRWRSSIYKRKGDAARAKADATKAAQLSEPRR